MAEPGEVPGEREHRGAVVDADPVDALDPDRLVAHDGGHRAFQHGEEVRVVLAHRVDDEPVDAGLVHRRDVGVLRADRHEQQARPACSHASASPSRKPVAAGSRNA